MSNMIDKRKIVARNNGQEYAHQYPFEGKNEPYQYKDEDKRVTNHVNSDKNKSQEQLYGIEIEKSNSEQQSSKIRVKLNNDEILEETTQRSYKIRNRPQIYDKTDPGNESYQLENNPREDEVNAIQKGSIDFSNRIQEESQIQLNTPAGRTQSYKENDNSNSQIIDIIFSIGMKIAHIEEDIKGEIKFVGKEKIAVIWEDNTRERFDIHDAKKSLIAYVDSTQEQVAPLETSSFPKSNDEITSIVDQALKALSADEIPETKESFASIDIEKIKLERKVNELQYQINSTDIEKIKNKAANELVNLMHKKGMILNSDDMKTKFDMIMKLDDSGFEAYQNLILSTSITQNASSNIDDVLAILEEDDFSDIEDGKQYAIDAEAIKKASSSIKTVDGIEMGDTSFFENRGMKNFKPVIGDFTNGEHLTSPTYNETRNTTTASKHKPIERKANSDFDLSGFEGIQGIKQPISIPQKEGTSGGKFQELFKDLKWTLNSK